MTSPEAAAGSIYDLGYRGYGGRRLGRRHAVAVVYLHSLRTAFGLGRRTGAKVIPIGLAVIALFPAALQLGIAAVAEDIITLVRPENHYSYIQVIIALFCAAVAPELMGRDLRSRTLALYFSRALAREDYVVAKLAALTTALLALTLLPQVVLFIGRGFARNDLGGYVSDEWDQVPAIAASALLISLSFGALSLWLGCQSPRRSYAAGGILATFMMTFAVAGIIVNLSEGILARLCVFLSPFHTARGFTLWLFNVDAEPDSVIARADMPGAAYALVALAFAALVTALVLRRYRRMAP
jgi:ABC-2 type transport system permease protein